MNQLGGNQLARVRTLAHWLDDGIAIPGTRMRFGVDAILDVVPFAGDLAGVALSGWIMLQAARMGASRATLLRMGWNVAIDALAGAVPGIGVFFDAAWKANLRNVALLERQTLDPTGTRRASRRLLLALAAAGVVIVVAGTVATIYLLRAGAALLRHTF